MGPILIYCLIFSVVVPAHLFLGVLYLRVTIKFAPAEELKLITRAGDGGLKKSFAIIFIILWPLPFIIALLRITCAFLLLPCETALKQRSDNRG